MKRITSFLLAFLLVVGLSVPACAYETEYTLVYDGSGLLDPAVVDAWEAKLETLTEETQIEFRIDVITDLKGYSVQEYADTSYDYFSYGYGENRDGVLLTLHMNTEDDSLSMENYAFSSGGTNQQTKEIAAAMQTACKTLLRRKVWSHNLAQDTQVFEDLMSVCVNTQKSVLGLSALPASAEDVSYVNDWAGLLTDDEKQELEAKAKKISETYQCSMYVFTVDDFRDFGTAVDEATMNLSDQYQLGYGTEKSSMILLLSMDDRDFATVAHGFGNTAFTDYGKQELDRVYLDDFKENNWYQGFSDYLNRSGEYLQMARDGKPFDVHTDPNHTFWLAVFCYGFCAFVGIVAAFVTCSGWKEKMETAKIQAGAAHYLIPEDIYFYEREDHYLYSDKERKYNNPNDSGSNDSSHSSGGTSVNERGYSSHTGKF